MGYDTRYEIRRVAPGSSPDPLLGHLRTISGYRRENFEGEQSCKWYDHDEHITAAMLASSTAEVDLHGEGEEQGDVWDKEYRLVDGKVVIKEYRYTLTRNAEPVSDVE